jgi:hypothetical protein
VDDLKGRQELYNGFGETMTRGIELAVMPFLFGGIGFGLDLLFGTKPLLTIAFALFAIVGLSVRTYYGYETAMRAHEADKPWGRPATARTPASLMAAPPSAEDATATDATAEDATATDATADYATATDATDAPQPAAIPTAAPPAPRRQPAASHREPPFTLPWPLAPRYRARLEAAHAAHAAHAAQVASGDGRAVHDQVVGR